MLVKKLSARVEPLRELFAGEELDRALELALQARRGLLSCLAEAVVEGLHRDLGVPLHLALGDPLEPLGLAPLPLDEHDVEARADVDLGALDRLGDGGLAGAKPLGDLVDRPPALERVRLELVERLRDGLARDALELLAQSEHGLALLVRRRAELRRLRFEPRLDLGDRLTVPLTELVELRLEVPLRALEVFGEKGIIPSARAAETFLEGLHAPLR